MENESLGNDSFGTNIPLVTVLYQNYSKYSLFRDILTICQKYELRNLMELTHIFLV